MQGSGISVVVPTFRRPASLRACLIGLEAQSCRAGELIVVIRSGDDETAAVLEQFADRVRRVEVQAPGAVVALRAGIEASSGEIIATIDDDAIPRAEWLQLIGQHFAADPGLGAVGGRDYMYEDGRLIDGHRQRVGRVLWWGRWVGNHHFVCPPQPVHYLKGVNMAFRREACGTFGGRLLGSGAQVSWEIDLIGGIRDRGWSALYDPGICVDHYKAVRHDSDGREIRSVEAQRNEVFNTLYAVLLHAHPVHWLTIVPFQILVGERKAPGVLMALLIRDRTPLSRAFLVARLRAVTTSLTDRLSGYAGTPWKWPAAAVRSARRTSSRLR